MSRTRAVSPPPLADFVFDALPAPASSMRPNAAVDVMVQSPVVLVRDEKWSPKKKPPPWSDGLVAELVYHLRDADQENLVVFLIDAEMRLVGIYEHSRGSSTSTPIDDGHILKMALLTSATNVVLCHNHPGGSPRPSEADHISTRLVARTLKNQGICLLYHLVVGDEGDVLLLPPEDGMNWKEERVDPAPLESLLALAKTKDMATRASARAYGKHALWLVKSGIVRSDRLKALRTRVGSLLTSRDIAAVAAVAWAGRMSLDSDAARKRVVIINVDTSLRVTSVVDIERTDVTTMARQVVAQGLISGGRAAFVAFYEDSFSEGLVRLLVREMGGTVHGMVQLLDVVAFDPSTERVVFSSKDEGWLD